MLISKNKLLIVILSFIIASTFNQNIYSENIYFYTKTTFADSQFWERAISKYGDTSLKVFSNFLSGTMGLGIEMVIWDIGIKRGSRIYFKGGVDLVFAGLSYVGAYANDNKFNVSMYPLNINGGAFFTGVDWDLFVGGTFPKTNLIWGFGCIWTFLFPSYSPKYNVIDLYQKFYFYATPAVLFGYDIIIPKSNFKITPQIRAGFTCNPVIPHELIRELRYNYSVQEKYSGFYVDFSLAFSFAQIKWKEEQ